MPKHSDSKPNRREFIKTTGKVTAAALDPGVAKFIGRRRDARENVDGLIHINARRCGILNQAEHELIYRTMMTGKWHLGTEPKQSPIARGGPFT